MQDSGISNPSKVWSDWQKQLNFLSYVEDELLRLYVGFGFYLGCPIEKDLWRKNKWLAGDDNAFKSLCDDYRSIAENVPSGYFCSELAECREKFSFFDTELGVHINTDIVRTQVEVSNLFQLGLLGNSKTILEIGGGYGQLAFNLLRNEIATSYIIVDLPFILDIVRRCASASFLEKSVRLLSIQDIENKKYLRPGLNLISNEHIQMLKTPIEADLIVNCNSFCEMKAEQVELYLSNQFCTAKLIYSSNRERQINNVELKSLSELLGKHGSLTPNYGSLLSSEKSNLKKYVYLLKKNSKSADQNVLEDVKLIKKLHGIFVKEMMGI